MVLLIFTFILPTFFDLFEGMDLPWNTKIMIALSKFLTQNWLAAFIITALIVLAVAILIKLPNVQSGIDSLKLKLPVVGNLMKTIYTARFARNLSALYASGMNMQCH